MCAGGRGLAGRWPTARGMPGTEWQSVPNRQPSTDRNTELVRMYAGNKLLDGITGTAESTDASLPYHMAG